MNVKRKGKLYEGKAKVVYKTDNKDLLILKFKDALTAFDGTKKAKLKNKGFYNCQITDLVFRKIKNAGVDSHMASKLSDTELVVRKMKMIPLEVVVRNYVTGSFIRRYGTKEKKLKRPLLEFFLKEDKLHDPLICENVIPVLGILKKKQVESVKEKTFVVNRVLKKLFDRMGIMLVDFKVEYGFYKNKILLGDEITPDACRLWDKKTGTVLDKDRFRKDLGNIKLSYETIYKRLMELK